MKPVILWTDLFIYFLLVGAFAFVLWARGQRHLRNAWQKVLRSRLAMACLVVLSVYVLIGLLDSIHFRYALAPTATGDVHYATKTVSLLDVLVAPLGQQYEKTYSAPFASHLYVKEMIDLPSGGQIYDYPRLQYAASNIQDPLQKVYDVMKKTSLAIVIGVVIWLLFAMAWLAMLAFRHQQSCWQQTRQVLTGQTPLPWRVFLLTSLVVIVILSCCFYLSASYHILGTDKIGQDVFYLSMKSVRTGLVIGTLTTLIMLPFAIALGLMAGYFSGWLDDVIQYIYTTLSSIPSVLLIAAAVLSLQVFITSHPGYFATIAEQADIRLLALCVILGVTSWTSLCRLLRAETLKVREIDYVQAARALGTGRTKILAKHILPNVMHIVIIAVIIDFSALVLAEAILSYVGVGVAPSTISWGNMINSARLELAREPVVWWPILAAFTWMFILVLTANLFADKMRDGFDPRVHPA